jgi:hypothetical protein
MYEIVFYIGNKKENSCQLRRFMGACVDTLNKKA